MIILLMAIGSYYIVNYYKLFFIGYYWLFQTILSLGHYILFLNILSYYTYDKITYNNIKYNDLE